MADILQYAFFTGFLFATLCAMTRGGRGWAWRLSALAVLVATDFAVQWHWDAGEKRLDQWLALCFAVKGTVLAALVFVLSRDSPGRRIFLATAYGAYAACYAAAFHLFTYRNTFGLAGGGSVSGGVAGLAVVAAMNLAFLFWVLPRMPRDARNFRWREPCIAAGVMLAALFTTGFWPVSVITAPARYCVPFALVAAAAWVVFPLLCRSMRDRLRTADAERSLALMMAEVKARREAIDEARRIRHDHRHHRIVLGDLLLRGKAKEALAYLNGLDEGRGEMSATTRIWCENETVNAILAVCSRKAAAAGVGFSAEAHVERTVPLPDAEIVAVVANLIENAVNAAGEMMEVEGQRSEVRDEVEKRGGAEVKVKGEDEAKARGEDEAKARGDDEAKARGDDEAKARGEGEQRSGSSLLSCPTVGRVAPRPPISGEDAQDDKFHCSPSPLAFASSSPSPLAFASSSPSPLAFASSSPSPLAFASSSPLTFASSPAVRVTLRQRGDMFGLTVANSVPAGFRLSAAGLPCAEPGIGLGSVRRVVDRHAGAWQYTLEDGTLTCELALYAGRSENAGGDLR